LGEARSIGTNNPGLRPRVLATTRSPRWAPTGRTTEALGPHGTDDGAEAWCVRL
jgi:hypothetical protein